MINKPIPELSQVQKDLGKYADQKLENAMRDIMQAFAIADRTPADAIACISCKCMGISLDIMSITDLSREQWVMLCGVLWDAKQRGREKRERAKCSTNPTTT